MPLFAVDGGLGRPRRKKRIDAALPGVVMGTCQLSPRNSRAGGALYLSDSLSLQEDVGKVLRAEARTS